MMIEKAKKLTGVVLLTLLIWIWAYSALEEQTVQSASLSISPAMSSELFVKFDESPPIQLKLTIKGPAAKIADLKRRLQLPAGDKEKETLDFYYNAEAEERSEPGTYPLDILAYLNKSSKMEKSGLTVEDCDVKGLQITVEKLEKRLLTVECIDNTGLALPSETIEPSKVEMFVRKDWTDEMLRATVSLTPRQIKDARRSPVTARPYIILVPGGKQRFASEPVEIKLPSIDIAKQQRPIQTRAGFVYGKQLQGRFEPILLNEDSDFSTIQVNGTEEALNAYEKAYYHILVEVRDGDENIEGDITREVIYNFPQQYVQKGEIELAGQPREAKFTLKPVTPAPITP